MAAQSITIRLALTDGGKVKAELADIGVSGQKALERIGDAAQPASRGLQALDAVGGALRGKMQEMAGSAGVLGEALQKIGPYGLATAAGVGAVSVALRLVIEEIEKFRAARARRSRLSMAASKTGCTRSGLMPFGLSTARV